MGLKGGLTLKTLHLEVRLNANGYLRSRNDQTSTGEYTNSNDDAIARVGIRDGY